MVDRLDGAGTCMIFDPRLVAYKVAFMLGATVMFLKIDSKAGWYIRSLVELCVVRVAR